MATSPTIATGKMTPRLNLKSRLLRAARPARVRNLCAGGQGDPGQAARSNGDKKPAAGITIGSLLWAAMYVRKKMIFPATTTWRSSPKEASERALRSKARSAAGPRIPRRPGPLPPDSGRSCERSPRAGYRMIFRPGAAHLLLYVSRTTQLPSPIERPRFFVPVRPFRSSGTHRARLTARKKASPGGPALGSVSVLCA